MDFSGHLCSTKIGTGVKMFLEQAHEGRTRLRGNVHGSEKMDFERPHRR